MNVRAIMLLLCLPLSAGLAADESTRNAEQATEYRLKAALIYSIAKFVAWPEAAEAGPELGICVLGADPFGASLDELASRTLRDRPLRVHRRINIGSLEQDCAIVFISESEQARLDLVLERLRGLPILTIGDVEGFAQAGGMVEFRVRDARLGFDINVAASDEAGIRINSQLLQVAARVLRGERA